MTKDKITFTLAKIKGWGMGQMKLVKLCKYLGIDFARGEDATITAKQLIDAIGIQDALWCLRTLDRKYDNLWRHLAVDYVENIKYTITDERSLNALVVARKHADGKASDDELEAAWDTAINASYNSTSNAAYNAACALACSAAYNSTSNAAYNAAYYAPAEDKYQAELLIEYCKLGKRS